LGPDGIARELSANAIPAGKAAAPGPPQQLCLPHLSMPAHHDVRPSDVLSPRLHASLAAAADRGPADFSELLLVPGVGARTVRALAMVAEVVHGAPYRFTDPARFLRTAARIASVSCAASGLRSDDWGAEVGVQKLG
jgi:hypothetical protein